MARALRKVVRDDLTIVRRRQGKGFCYLDASGAVVRDVEVKARAKALGIPPAWKDVRIAPHERSHIQALGTDDAGRMQYIYHADWEQKRASRKQYQLTLLTNALPKIRRRVQQDLAAETGSLQLALAIGVALIDRTAMRVGRERYLETSGTRGAGTLFSKDVTVAGDEVTIEFDAKGGKRALYAFTDKRLAAALGRIKTLSGKRLLVHRDQAGKVKPIKTSAINDYLVSASGVHVSAKDFRTLHASALAGEALAALELGLSASARKRQMAKVVRDVSEVLRNTPMICRKSYIAPCLFQLFDEGKLQTLWVSNRTRAGLKQREQRLGALLGTLVEAVPSKIAAS